MLLFNYFEWADLSEVSLKGILIFLQIWRWIDLESLKSVHINLLGTNLERI